MRHMLKNLIVISVCLFMLPSLHSTDASDLGDVALKWSLLRTLIALPVCFLTWAWLDRWAGEDAGATPAQPARAQRSCGVPRVNSHSRNRTPIAGAACSRPSQSDAQCRSSGASSLRRASITTP